jgi:ribosomal protein S18 acetylase RimI-like enzyme
VSELIVRRALAPDLEVVGEVTVAAYLEFVDGPEDFYLEHLRDAARRDREAELWVAERESDGLIVGTVTIAPEGSQWREIARPGEGEFRMLAVAPSARRQGVGQALTQLVVDRFRSLGSDSIVLSTLAQMEGAHRIYRRFGFERLPERDWSPAPGVELIAFGMPLVIETA